MYKKILIPTDGSRLSRKAVTQGVELARSVGAEVRAVMATPSFRFFTLDPLMSRDSPEQYARHTKRIARKALDAVARTAASAGVPCATRHVVNDHPFKAILGAAKRERCDLILMASHGRKGVSALVLGSETSKVLAHSRIPVLVCR